MKAIINGVRYDTDKSHAIGEAGNVGLVGYNDFSFWSATLYRTPRSGRYFLAGEGGARSMFSRSAGQNSWCGGEGIIPFEDRAAALAWAEKELDAETVEAEFGDMVEDA